MRASRKSAWAVLLILVFPIQGNSEGTWKKFTSSTGFSVMYPGSWFRIGISTDRLAILSSEGGAEGIVIKRGQAEIIVTELQGPPGASLSELIRRDLKEEFAILFRRDLNSKTQNEAGCGLLKEVVSEQEAVAADVPARVHVPHIINTGFYCEIAGRKFSTLSKNWKGDERQRQYQRIALQVARSLRIGPD